MSAGRRSPFEGTTRLVVDGTNLLYRLGVGHGVFGRLAQGMFVRYAGRRTGDDVILDLTSEAAMEAGGGPDAASGVLVVTNDRDLRDRLVLKGARTVPLQWLIDRMGLPVLQSASPGNKRPTIGTGAPPPGGGGPNAAGREGDRPGWKPGRGATAKTGTARKVARHKRHPRMGA